MQRRTGQNPEVGWKKKSCSDKLVGIPRTDGMLRSWPIGGDPRKRQEGVGNSITSGKQ